MLKSHSKGYITPEGVVIRVPLRISRNNKYCNWVVHFRDHTTLCFYDKNYNNNYHYSLKLAIDYLKQNTEFLAIKGSSPINKNELDPMKGICHSSHMTKRGRVHLINVRIRNKVTSVYLGTDETKEKNLDRALKRAIIARDKLVDEYNDSIRFIE